MDDPNQTPSAPSTTIPDKPTTTRSKRIKIPTRYVRDIQSGIGTIDGRPVKSSLPSGIRISELISEIEGETEDDCHFEHAMAAAISEIEAIDPQSLEEAM